MKGKKLKRSEFWNILQHPVIPAKDKKKIKIGDLKICLDKEFGFPSFQKLFFGKYSKLKRRIVEKYIVYEINMTDFSRKVSKEDFIPPVNLAASVKCGFDTLNLTLQLFKKFDGKIKFEMWSDLRGKLATTKRPTSFQEFERKTFKFKAKKMYMAEGMKICQMIPGK